MPMDLIARVPPMARMAIPSTRKKPMVVTNRLASTFANLQQEPGAVQHERDAEDGAHVEDPTGFDVGVCEFGEFDEEAGGEKGDEEGAEEEAFGRLAVVAAVEGDEDEEDEEDGGGFVEHGGVAGDHALGGGEGGRDFEDDSPGEVACFAEDFGVHEVADTDEGATYGDGWDDAVGDPEEGDVGGASGVKPHGEDDSDGGAVAGEAAGPDLRDEVEVAKVVFGVVKEDVPEACTDDGGEEHVNEQAVDLFRGASGASHHAGGNDVAGDEGGGEQDAIPAGFDRADGVDGWADAEDHEEDLPDDDGDSGEGVAFPGVLHGFGAGAFAGFA